jgi:hypothetical protein
MPPPAAVPYKILAPDLEKSSLRPIERLGYELYLRDIAASRATDAALAVSALSDRGAIGWIVVPREDGYLVRFLNRAEKSVVDASVDPHSALSPYVVINSPGLAISARELGMWRARKLASEQAFRACSDQYNTVVLPENEDADSNWIVYLLAATQDPTKVMLGGHHKFLVDFAGSKILSQEALTNSCFSTIYREGDSIITVSQIVSAEPLATHVYLNLLHGIAIGIVVIDTENVYVIEDGRVLLIKTGEPERGRIWRQPFQAR